MDRQTDHYCNTCRRRYAIDTTFFRCSGCEDESSNICNLCVLETDHDSQGHTLRPCVTDMRDGEITWLQGPDDAEFRLLIALAQSDDTFTFPSNARRLLCTSTEPIPGLTIERIQSDKSYHYEPHDHVEAARTRKVNNDYSLYQPLNRGKREIRMALLMAAEDDAPVSVIVVRMAEPWTRRAYTALSYCWGSLDETRFIGLHHSARKVDGEAVEGAVSQKFECTANLEIALRALRKKHEPVVLWIDALCINQADLSERAYQVGLMSEVYANAASVCVWLSMTDAESKALQFISAIGRASEEAKSRGLYQAPGQVVALVRNMLHRGQFKSANEQFSQLDALKIISCFFNNDWFRRVWVLQEVWSAQNEVWVCARGGLAVPWDKIVFANTFLSVGFVDLKSGLTGMIEPWKSLDTADTKQITRSRRPILEIFEGVCQNFQSTDIRDRLYAILALGEETYNINHPKALIAPDYTKSTTRVFIDFTIWHILATKTLRALGYVTYLKRDITENYDEMMLPSWSLSPTPRFRTFGQKLSDVHKFNACNNNELDIKLLLSSHLVGMRPRIRLRGYQLGIVRAADKLYFSTRWDDENDLYLMDETTQTYYSGGLSYVWAQLVMARKILLTANHSKASSIARPGTFSIGA